MLLCLNECSWGERSFLYHLFKTTYLVGEPWLNRKCFEGMLAPLPFASFMGRRVAWSWKVVVLCHPCVRSLLLGCHLLSLAFLEGGVAGFCGDGSRSPG